MMTLIRVSLVLTLALFLASASSAAETKALSGAQSVDEAWSKAITANDLEALMLCYSKDAVMWLPGAPEAKGTEAIRKAYVELLAANTVTAATFANTHYESSGNLSVGWGEFTLSMSPKAGGNPVSMSGQFSVIAMEEAGKWTYVVDHASASPAAAAP